MIMVNTIGVILMMGTSRTMRSNYQLSAVCCCCHYKPQITRPSAYYTSSIPAQSPESANSTTSSDYRSGTVNSNTVISEFHLIRSYCEIFFYHFPNIPCLKYTVNSNFHLIRSKTLLTNDFELTVPNL